MSHLLRDHPARGDGLGEPTSALFNLAADALFNTDLDDLLSRTTGPTLGPHPLRERVELP